ncbi:MULTISPECIES: ABC transporter permease [unclassified Planococcus (in: firmicutes)]|uniref:ABC transporter permease n=1 Tax=Planococcus TaxID=1372 RepID=UPI0011EE8DCB|nr:MULTISPECIES: ABC transporter permease [unclassified Planococcus (in: firmicutes)]KAA0956366.1 ABC transporter permease [Planococcus sp. ANT_H30]MDJ0332890.1 ABC transporter permease [Planococcus sp. S3-L1]
MKKWTVVWIVIFAAILERAAHHLFLTDSFAVRLVTASIFIAIGVGGGLIVQKKSYHKEV